MEAYVDARIYYVARHGAAARISAHCGFESETPLRSGLVKNLGALRCTARLIRPRLPQIGPGTDLYVLYLSASARGSRRGKWFANDSRHFRGPAINSCCPAVDFDRGIIEGG